MLIAGGCSFVWGDELDGAYDNPPSHEKIRCSELVADRLGIKCVNKSACGNGNDKILRDFMRGLLDPKFRGKYTHAFILWSAPQRKELVQDNFVKQDNRFEGRRDTITRDHNLIQFSQERIYHLPEQKWGGACTYYNQFYDVRIDIMNLLTYMTTVQSMCEGMGIKLIQGFFHERVADNLQFSMVSSYNNGAQKFSTLLGDLIGLLRKKTSRVGFQGAYHEQLKVLPDFYTYAKKFADIKLNGHPDELANRLYAKELYDMYQNPDYWRHLEDRN